MEPHVRDWVDYLQALSAPFAVAAAICIPLAVYWLQRRETKAREAQLVGIRMATARPIFLAAAYHAIKLRDLLGPFKEDPQPTNELHQALQAAQFSNEQELLGLEGRSAELGADGLQVAKFAARVKQFEAVRNEAFWNVNHVGRRQPDFDALWWEVTLLDVVAHDLLKYFKAELGVGKIVILG
jgi:hypothetical protein